MGKTVAYMAILQAHRGGDVWRSVVLADAALPPDGCLVCGLSSLVDSQQLTTSQTAKGPCVSPFEIEMSDSMIQPRGCGRSGPSNPASRGMKKAQKENGLCRTVYNAFFSTRFTYTRDAQGLPEPMP
jgi:hypothetical protein